MNDEDKSVVPVTARLKEDSLKEMIGTPLRVSMRWVILDWDLPSKGTPWGAEGKTETKEQLSKFIEGHDRLKHAYGYYFSKSGVRILYALANPLQISTSDHVLVWKEFFRRFVKSIDVSEIGGEIEERTDPFCLNRVPKYTSTDGTVVEGDIHLISTERAIRVAYPTLEEAAAATKKPTQPKVDYPKLDTNTVCATLWMEPFLQHLRDNNTSLHYQDWRALGTNIAALLGETDGLPIFNDISSWDTANYSQSAVQTQWPHIVRSAEEYGPTTWSQFQTKVIHDVYGHVNPKSSLAAQVRRAVKNATAHGTASNTIADNSQQVYQNLYTQTKMVGGQAVSNPTKCLSNLQIILTQDNRWRDKIRRNHLGSIDMLGDEPILDEHITAMRETISRVYGLAYSKDEVWDFVKLISQQNEYHPVADHLNTLTWDGQDRIYGLAASLGQTDPFTYTVLRKFLISCVVRPLEWNNFSPRVNWKIDTVLILKGTQGKRKSSFFKALCEDEEWFSDNLPSISHERKDASMHMLGKWIVEQAEFEGHVARSSVENMKAFITREREIFRKPYGRAEINMRRPSILVGTTNSSNFLNDPTGDRRFWVLEIPDTHTIDLAWVRANRDQLWAQAVDLYNKGVAWWLTEAESVLSNVQNSKFRRPDALHEAILEFLNTEPTMANIKPAAEYEDNIGFTLKQLVTIGLDKKLSDLKSYETQSITSYLSKMGYMKLRTRVNGQRMYIFRKLKNFDDEEVY
jgi:predicted P-loop ATPase